MEVILGLDISTSCTGYSLLSPDTSLIDMGYVKLDSSKDLFSRAVDIEKCILRVSGEYVVKKIYVEQNLQAFRSGFSSAKTIEALARFNGIVSYIAYQITGIIPEYINVNSARKSVGLKIDRKSSQTTKEQVFEWVSSEICDTGHLWPTKILKSGPRKGSEILEPGCYDMSDAYVIARAGLLV